LSIYFKGIALILSNTTHSNSIPISDSLTSVTRGKVGEAVTFTCQFSDVENTRIKWYKQAVGDTLKLITVLMKGTVEPTFEEGISPSRFNATYTTVKSTMTILKTVKEDEAFYHCAISTWKMDYWTGTFLSLKGNSANLFPIITHSVIIFQPGDSVTLQCSIISDSQTSSCPSEHCVSWFGVRKDTILENILFTHKNGFQECDSKAEESSSTMSCIYHLSMNVSSSDSGTYYCALVTCGEVIFGNGEKLQIEGELNLIVIAVLIWSFSKNKCVHCKGKNDTHKVSF
uniref:Ig-like domain-containing protein n=1 Tax=Nothobranchius furzeri TaxID=105023 RepID=A0A8C6KEJ3_NOTFU